MKTKLLVLIGFLIGFTSFSQNTYVPDDNFEQALINWGYDSLPLDDYVPTSNIETVTFLDIQFNGISDLTGIEDFAALEILQCSYNLITSLDLSQNTALSYLECISNQLTSLNINQNTSLTTLDCQDNLLASLDVSQNVLLNSLNCSSNNLTSLNISQNTALSGLSCNFNQLTSLDLSQNSDLKFFNCYDNQLTSLDVTQNTMLTNLNCYNNQLSNLDLSQNLDLIFLYCYNNDLSNIVISSNTVLSQLSCQDNQLASLDLTQNTQIAVLIAENNDLTSLDIKNGNNSIINTFRTTGNPNLTCINVDNAAYSAANWTDIDTQHYFDENCPAMSTNEFGVSTFSMYPNPVNELLILDLIENANYAVLNLGGQILKQGVLTKGENKLDLSNLNSGFYFIKVETNERSITKKFIKA